MKKIIIIIVLGLSLFANSHFYENKIGANNSVSFVIDKTLYFIYPKTDISNKSSQEWEKTLKDGLCQNKSFVKLFSNGYKAYYFYVDPKSKHKDLFIIDSCKWL